MTSAAYWRLPLAWDRAEPARRLEHDLEALVLQLSDEAAKILALVENFQRRDLELRIVIWRVDWKWYLIPTLGSATLWTLALALDPLLGGTGLHVPALSADLLLGMVSSLVLIFLINSEELAWRGFGMPRLQARHSAVAASLFLGVVEGLFHLPYSFRPSSDQAAAGLPVFVVGSMAGTAIFAWLFNNTRGSLLLVMLFHAFRQHVD